MTVINTHIIVAEDGSVSLATPLPPGEHPVRVELSAPRTLVPIDWATFPMADLGPWPEGATFGRDEIYGDDGR